MSKDPAALYRVGLSLLQQGKLEDAVTSYREALQLNPKYPEAYNDLGVALWMQGKLDDAINCYHTALEINPDYLEPYLNLGVTLTDQGRVEDAVSVYRKALELNPNYAQAHNNLGVVLQEQNRLEEGAALSLGKAVELKPDYAQAYFNLGIVLKNLGRFDDAISSYRRAIDLQPNNPEAYLNLGETMTGDACFTNDPKKLDDAVDCYRKALELKPDYAEAHFNTGLVSLAQRKIDDAACSFYKAIELKPKFPEAYIHLGFALKEQNRMDDAISAYRHALELRTVNLDSNGLVRRVGGLLFELDRLPVIYKDVAEIQTNREHFTSCLNEASLLVSSNEATFTAEERTILKEVLFRITNFYLAYQQMNDRELQTSYSRLATAILSLEKNEYLTASKVSHSRTKIRLGIASAYLQNHNGSFWAYNWLSNFPSEDYEFFLYSLNGMTDEVTQKFAALGTYRWLPFKEDNYHRALQVIKEDNLDVLLLPDVGMSIPSRIISLARLAPIQCVAWGHPMTTGSPNIDYYLSCELMETDEADSHYSEQLVRLPNIGIYVDYPEISYDALTRADFGIPENKILYGSVQSIFKHLPQFDFVYPALARRVPNSFFVFVGSECESVTGAFKERLRNAFEQEGLNFEQYVKVLPRLSCLRFMQLLDVVDVNLDSIGWSGGITTINSLARNCPVITLPGEFMRGRHSYAMLKMIGLEELIANTPDEYISLAAKIGSDSDLRSSIVQKIKAQLHRLFKDMECVEYLDAFLKSKVAEVRADLPPPVTTVKQIDLDHSIGSFPLYFRDSSSDETVIQQTLVNQEYSLTRLKLNSEIEKFVASNAARGLRPLILDLGANIGASAVWYLRNYPAARVIAVEPDQGNYDLLAQNTKSFDCIAIKGAVASEKGYTNIHDPGLGYFGLRTQIDSSGLIEAFTVPELIGRYGGGSLFPFIVKVDIEGGEAELFSKNTEWIDQFPILIIELHDWLLPNTNTSRNFLQCIANRARDFVYIGENIFSIRTPLDCAGLDSFQGLPQISDISRWSAGTK